MAAPAAPTTSASTKNAAKTLGTLAPSALRMPTSRRLRRARLKKMLVMFTAAITSAANSRNRTSATRRRYRSAASFASARGVSITTAPSP